MITLMDISNLDDLFLIQLHCRSICLALMWLQKHCKVLSVTVEKKLNCCFAISNVGPSMLAWNKIVEATKSLFFDIIVFTGKNYT